MKRIQIVNSKKHILLDDIDYSMLNLYNWYYHNNQVTTSINGKTVHIGRFILGVTDPSLVVDHINGNTLDNRRKNLRVCTVAENGQNQRPQRISKYSKYKGVSWRKQDGKWIAQVEKDGKKLYYGYFFTEIEAAKAYNVAAKQYFGEFARLNDL